MNKTLFSYKWFSWCCCICNKSPITVQFILDMLPNFCLNQLK